jgi:hypothetical protein
VRPVEKLYQFSISDGTGLVRDLDSLGVASGTGADFTVGFALGELARDTIDDGKMDTH